MEFLNLFLPILLYTVAIVLLVLLIIISVKVIYILNHVDNVIANVEKKVNSFDGAIAVLNKAVSGVASVSDSIVFGLASTVSKIFKKKKEEENIYE